MLFNLKWKGSKTAFVVKVISLTTKGKWNFTLGQGQGSRLEPVQDLTTRWRCGALNKKARLNLISLSFSNP